MTSSGGLSRAALQALKDAIQEMRDEGCALGNSECCAQIRSFTTALGQQVDALLTAPSSQQEENERHDDEQARGGTMGSPSDSLTASQYKLIRALAGYVQHKAGCGVFAHETVKLCTCGLADLLTPASAEEADK